MDREAQVQALARRLLEARGGGELVVLLRGGDAFGREFAKGRRSCASKAVVTRAAASSAEATVGVQMFGMPRTVIMPWYLPLRLYT